MIFLDSNFIIDFLKGKKSAVSLIKKNNEELATSQINVFEVLFGIFMKKETNRKELDLAEAFFQSIIIFPFDSNCGNLSAKILSSLMKEGKTIEQNDCFIGAIMIKNRIDKIISNNVKHFSKINGVKIITY